MLPISEVRKAERDRLERATWHEAMTNQRGSLLATIANLEAREFNVESLRRMHALCGDVPADLMTGGSSTLGVSIGAGMIVREVLMVVIGGALAAARRKEEKRDEQLTAARTTLAKVEAELSALERTA